MFTTNLDRGHGRGIAVYVDSSLSATPIYQDSDGAEQLWLRVKLARGDYLTFGCVYRSPGSTEENNELLNKTLRDIVAEGHTHLLVCGDYNFPDIDWGSWTAHQ